MKSRFVGNITRTGILAVVTVLGMLGSEIARSQTLQPRQSYQIHPGDQLDVRFRLTPEHNQIAIVQPDGMITLAISGQVHVVNQTIEEAEAAIAKNSSSRLKDPEVTITLLSFQKPYFVMAGMVARPGKYDMVEDTTAMQALLLAGGSLEGSKVSQILLYRKINGAGAEVRVINLKNIKKTGDLERDCMLKSGDMLYVTPTVFTTFSQYLRVGNSLGLYMNPLTLVQ